MAQAGAAKKIRAVTGKEVSGPAIPAAKQLTPSKIQAGPALAVQIVDDAYIAVHGLQAGKSIPVYQVTTGKVEAGPVVPVYLTEGGVTVPVADFVANDTTPAVDQPVTFTDLSTNTPTSWDWDFGDGTAHSTSQNPTHTYTEIGTFTVTLIATNAAGSDTETKVGYIVVTTYTLNFTGLAAFPALWTAPNWTVSANTAKNTPTQGSERVTNGSFAGWTGDNPNSWTTTETLPNYEVSEVGTGEGHGGAGTGLCNLYRPDATNTVQVRQNGVIPTIGQFYRYALTVDTVVAGSIIVNMADGSARAQPDPSSAGSIAYTARPTNVNFVISVLAASTDVTIDNASIKQLSAVIAYRNLGENDIIVKAPWTIAAGFQSGVIALSDGTFNNCLAAMHNRLTGTAVLLQYVAGSVTALISAVTAYVAGANVEIRVSSNGSQAELYYNNVKIGATQAPNAAIQANTIVGLFSTDVSCTVPSFSVVSN